MAQEKTPSTVVKQRSLFSSRTAFILAAAASAIGLGNLWRFPSLAAKHGGGAFLVTYIILVLTFGFTIMISEITLGRKTGKSAIHAFSDLSKKYKFIGVLASLVPMIITPYYCVIGGWILKYMFTYLTGGAAAAATGGDFFMGFVGTTVEPLIWTFIFVALVVGVVALGVKNGIERLNAFLMPALFILMISLAIFALVTMSGAMDGLAYYLIPKPEDFGFGTLVAAATQLFFSLSLAMGIMITYGSYMSKQDNIEASTRKIEIFDTLAAFVAGLMIIPPVFAMLGAEGAQQGGVGLMFMTMPGVFENMPLGAVVGFLFFTLVLFAAATSATSLTETIVSIFHDSFTKERKTAVIAAGLFVLIFAIPPTLGFSAWSGVSVNIGQAAMGILDLMDFFSNSVLMPIVALLTCIFAGWIIGPKIIKDEIEEDGHTFKMYGFYTVMVKFVAPIILVIILVTTVLGTMGVIQL